MPLAIVLLLAVSAVSAQTDSQWRDPSPHKVRFVTVDESVRVEVLDWGGKGRPLLFVGCYQTAHAYDQIGPKLTPIFASLQSHDVGSAPQIGRRPGTTHNVALLTSSR